MIHRLPRGFSHPMRVGTGAFASVYRAQQTALDRRVALKFIYEKNRIKRRDLLKEAQTQAKLRAGCVPQIFDAFEWHGSVCMVMEWVRGVSLASLLESQLTENDRVSIADSLIRALAQIHQLDFAHRDLKPENILLSPVNGLYLVDFGFSKNISEAAASSVNTAKGTPAYMAPELWSHGGKVDLMRVDVFAAGRILQQVLSGTALAGFAASCISVNPLQRPSSGMELLGVWEEAAHGTTDRHSWEKLAGECVAEQLSTQLLAAARKLLDAHRSDEAYWLLVECLEENGNNHEAVELLGSFQKHSGTRNKMVQVSLFAAILFAGVLLAFFAGMQSRKGQGTENYGNRQSARAKLTGNFSRYGMPGSALLRRDSLVTDQLYGTILVRNMPQAGSITIDGDTLNSDTVANKGAYVRSGSHEVIIYDSSRRILKRETVGVLPFQVKAVDAVLNRVAGRGKQK